jgi:superfamily II DNA/RNA helicase
MTGHDVIGQAKTGTGKTLGFGLPIIDSVRVAADVDAGRLTAAELPTAPQALVVVPTRELCTQVTNDLLVAGKVRDVRVLSIYGGRGYETQIAALERGVDVIVGTPGRLLDLARQKKLDLSAVRTLVLDEADEMLDLGFLPDVEKIIDLLPAQRQTMLFSATMPGAVIGLARRYMSRPTHIRATQPDDEGATVANISQHVFRAHSLDKVEMVSRILQAEGRNLAMIFCRTKRTTADVAEQLTKRGFAAGAVHGDLGQGAREQALRAFRNGKVDILVCTDVAARGIDVEGVTHVINYQCPEDEKTYLHRIGRTGRAGASGTAVTLVDWDDIPRWQLINKALDLKFNDPEETYSSSAHLYEQLNIAPGTRGLLPRSERTRAGLDAEEIEDLGEPGGGRRRGTSKPAGRAESRTRDRDAERDADRPAGRRERDRKRRRTRGGLDAETTAEAPVTATDAPAAQPALDEAPDVSDAPRRRRRRTRGGDQAGVPAEAVVDAVEAATVETTEPVAEAAPAVTGEAPPEPRRRRTRAAKAPAEALVETVEMVVEAVQVEDVMAEVVAETPAPRKRTRAAKKAVAEANDVTDVTDVGDVAEAPVVDTVESAAVAPALVEEAPAPRRRTRTTKKTAEALLAEVVDTVAEIVEETPAPRKRTRAPKATAALAPETLVVTETPVADEAPAPRKRTRATKKTAEALPAEVVDTVAEIVEETPAPRKRTRATKKAVAEANDVTEVAEVTEAPVVETIEAPAVAPALVEEAPAPRRRTRTTKKTAEALPAEVVDTVAEVVEEAPAPRRRTRAPKATAELAPETLVVTETPVAEETPEPRKRTRAAKKAVTVEPAKVDAVAEAIVAEAIVATPAPVEPVAAAPVVAPRKRRRATSGVTDASLKAAGLLEPEVEAEAPAPVESTTLPAPRKRRRATSGVTDASLKATERAAVKTAEPEVPTQRVEAESIDAEEERPKRKRRSVRLAEAAAASAAAEAAEAAVATKRTRARA